ncbi:MAG: enoyl-CoA hydratase/carnithine racemase [Myxococcota bacterium]|jgi:enoyl-CoA hydratase/carnithine racemase/acyl-CoA reductase-like NAD-dependent aldehyde dehydrogenase
MSITEEPCSPSPFDLADRAIKARVAWGSATIAKRVATLSEIGRTLARRRPELDAGLAVDGLTAFMARPYGDWIVSQADPERMTRYGAELVREEVGALGPEFLVRRPDGLVLLVPPGSSPTINCSCLFSILLPGNAVILRAPRNDQGMRFIAEDVVGGVLEAEGFSRDLVQVITSATRPFLDHYTPLDQVRTVVFFGNARVGQAVAERCLAAGKKVVLELEGSDNLIVWKDAPIDRAVDSALRGFDFSSQPCAVPKHLLVHGAVYDEFVRALMARLPERSRTIQHDREAGVLAPVARREDYFACLEEAQESGAVLCGGHAMDAAGVRSETGPYLEPTLAVFDSDVVVSKSLKLFTEEISFPLIPIVRFDDDRAALDQMLQVVSDSPFGLRASVWSEDPEVLTRCVREIGETGLLVLNGAHCHVPSYASPWGGPGKSGGTHGESHLFWEKTSHLQAIALGSTDPAVRRAVLKGLGIAAPVSPVSLVIDKHVAWLTLNRPERHNAVNGAMKEALLKAARRLQRDIDSLRCVVIQGEGQSFCSGADLSELGEMTPDGARRFMMDATWAFRAIEQLPVPVIAAVKGYCLGGGLELMLHCDEVVAAERSSFGFPEANLGLITTAGAVSRLVGCLGVMRARELVLTGRRIDAMEAVRMGLVNQVVPTSELESAVQQRVDRHLKQPREGLAALKSLIAMGQRRSSEAWISEVEAFDKLLRDQKERAR